MQAQAPDDIKYDLKTVQALRGREGSIRTKWQEQGWEFVSERRGVLRTELSFRRVKAKTLSAYFSDAVRAFRGLQPRMQVLLAAAAASILAAGVIGIAVAGQHETQRPARTAASSGTSPTRTAAPSETVTTSSPRSSSEPSGTPTTRTRAPAADAPVVNISVDSLLNKLNANESRAGDRFRVTGELFHSELWFTGATGDYSVMMKAQGGAQDLSIFVAEPEARDWQDGTKVVLVLKNVERTINGETTDGWLEVQSAKTL